MPMLTLGAGAAAGWPVAAAAPARVVITGANRGLGLALAGELAAAGLRVLQTTRQGGSQCREAAAVLEARGLSVEAYDPPLDMADVRSVARFAASREAAVGIDAVVHNAAVCEPGWSAPVVRRALRTNVVGPLTLTRLLQPAMRGRGRACLLGVSSGDGELAYLNTPLQAELRGAGSARQLLRVLARAGPPANAFGVAPAHGPTPAYSVSKAALNALARIAADAAPEPGLWVGAVCPGDVLTRMCTDVERAVTPEEAAADVAWLLREALRDEALPSGRFWRARAPIEF